jgi:hypothetical protein
MSEYDANQWLLQAAPDPVDPLEQTQRMPVADRRYRQHEARVQNWRALDEQIARVLPYHGTTRPPGWQFEPVSAVLERKQYVDIKP